MKQVLPYLHLLHGVPVVGYSQVWSADNTYGLNQLRKLCCRVIRCNRSCACPSRSYDPQSSFQMLFSEWLGKASRTLWVKSVGGL
ncbi:MAG: hypothetical protein ABW185_07640 [Sedimenticola sp.]